MYRNDLGSWNTLAVNEVDSLLQPLSYFDEHLKQNKTTPIGSIILALRITRTMYYIQNRRKQKKTFSYFP